MKKLWLSNQVFSWISGEYEASIVLELRHLKRAYELWNHANKSLNTSDEELFRVDALSTLKRCLNHRLKLIESIYELKKIAEKNSPKDYLGYLERFGIVRSSMLKSLLLIRNNIEHEDKEPPSYERCIELLDSVWYFLRSTDEIVRLQKYGCTYKLDHNNVYALNVTVQYQKNHQFDIWGWVPADYISEIYISNYSELEIVEVRQGSDINYNKIPSTEIVQNSEMINSHRKPDDFFINGSLIATNALKIQIIKDALCAL